ncbi:hypothetical protein [Saccharopolyspora sp. ASAGF58]|uniref:hypothetical protein n=1 Tax=Saccharopolyspora sp. ASAGF58 TaxID=2719023 RepID=UPI0014486CC9|nr:hypothetical protein [Saccharopolyspora sp. ASAGF58]
MPAPTDPAILRERLDGLADLLRDAEPGPSGLGGPLSASPLPVAALQDHLGNATSWLGRAWAGFARDGAAVRRWLVSEPLGSPIPPQEPTALPLRKQFRLSLATAALGAGIAAAAYTLTAPLADPFFGLIPPGIFSRLPPFAENTVPAPDGEAPLLNTNPPHDVVAPGLPLVARTPGPPQPPPPPPSAAAISAPLLSTTVTPAPPPSTAATPAPPPSTAATPAPLLSTATTPAPPPSTAATPAPPPSATVAPAPPETGASSDGTSGSPDVSTRRQDSTESGAAPIRAPEPAGQHGAPAKPAESPPAPPREISNGPTAVPPTHPQTTPTHQPPQTTTTDPSTQTTPTPQQTRTTTTDQPTRTTPANQPTQTKAANQPTQTQQPTQTMPTDPSTQTTPTHQPPQTPEPTPTTTATKPTTDPTTTHNPSTTAPAYTPDRGTS